MLYLNFNFISFEIGNLLLLTIRPPSGTWNWNGGINYRNNITYTCGPYGKLRLDNGTTVSSLVSTCAWNKTWSPATLPPCIATHCPIIPFPPPSTGLIFHTSTAKGSDSFLLTSQFSAFGPRIPARLPFPGPGFCQAEQKQVMMAIGRVTSTGKRNPTDISFLTEEGDEGFHARISLGDSAVYGWRSANGSVDNFYGSPGDGTSIDLNEPFVLKIRWVKI